jgi:predicted amidohydrolase/8-oxo-dGTP pyrophosphatase MutT (NUDIX family)
VRILLAAITCAKGDLDANLATHLTVLADASRAGADLVVFPEMSLTGSVDPTRHPERAVPLDHATVGRLVAATLRHPLAVLFGMAERRSDGCWITQVQADGGQIRGVQRKRHLGEDEEGFDTATDTSVFELGEARYGSIICAESTVARTWDANAAGGATLHLLSAAPGLTGRRTDAEGWRAGLEWWEGAGLADAEHHARRLGAWVGVATQAGSTVDEDFPGVAAMVSPDGAIVARLPDERPGTLLVDVPVPFEVQPVRWAVRVLVVDGGGRTLLAQFGDDHPAARWWVPPGGGMEAGEDDRATAHRELREELGRDDLVLGARLGGRGGTFRPGGRWFTQHERWYLCRCDGFEVAPEVVHAARAEGIRELRWWSVDELRAHDVVTAPRGLADLLERILAGDLPDPDGDLGR